MLCHHWNATGAGVKDSLGETGSALALPGLKSKGAGQVNLPQLLTVDDFPSIDISHGLFPFWVAEYPSPLADQHRDDLSSFISAERISGGMRPEAGERVLFKSTQLHSSLPLQRSPDKFLGEQAKVRFPSLP